MVLDVLGHPVGWVPEPLYHFILPSDPHTPASVIDCSTPPLYTWAVKTVEPELFLNTVPFEVVIVTVIASAPGLPVGPVAPWVPIIAGVESVGLPLVYVVLV